MELNKLSITELKALWFDQFSAKTNLENNLILINKELATRTAPSPISAVEDDVKELSNG